GRGGDGPPEHDRELGVGDRGGDLPCHGDRSRHLVDRRLPAHVTPAHERRLGRARGDATVDRDLLRIRSEAGCDADAAGTGAMRRRHIRQAALCGCAAALTSLLSGVSIRAQDVLRVSCLPAKTIALPGETIAVNAWVASDTGAVTRNVTVHWAASAGRIDDQSPTTRWRLEGADINRRHTATVDI